MKKPTMLSAIVLTTIFGMASQANTDTKTAETTVATPPSATETTAATPPSAEAAPAKPKLTAVPVSPQVQKLIGLHPRLIARIQPHGRVCFDGGECDITISVLTASADGQPRDGQTIYKAVCHTCHDSGLVGSPKLGDKGAWSPRVGKGKDALYNSAINGLNAMPPKGGADIADEEVKNAVDYIISQSS
ncbi:MAG: c-type cytochrome [Moraxella sp.]|nr:c-type cytochrome [Moraxella sp.]